MSAAAARRRKQLAARKAGSDNVSDKLNQLLALDTLDEATAYEALQLAQSTVRKQVQQGSGGCELCHKCAAVLLKKGRVAVASQLLTLLTDTLRETATEETDEWLDKLIELHVAHQAGMKATAADMSEQETARLQRLERDWLLRALQWSADAGTIKMGHHRLQKVLGEHCWMLAQTVTKTDDEDDELAEMQCDAVNHMVLAEDPETLLSWLKTLDAPTDAETKAAHTCPPALRDSLFTRALLLLAAVQNLRDAHILLKGYTEIEERTVEDLAKSYTSKDDGRAPSHLMFGNMLLRILAKDARTGPLFSWLMRSFKKELDLMHKPQAVHGWATKIGMVYFNIQPPPNMLSMMENMMSGLGGGGGMGGMNPAMMQALAAQMGGAM